MSLDIKLLNQRAVLLRNTVKQGAAGCRVISESTELDLVRLGYRLSHGKWPALSHLLVPLCGTEGCVMHLGYKSEQQQDIQLVADSRPTPSLAQVFRLGRARGLFRGSSSYAT